MAWTANPGVFVYNRYLAKKYIGSADPKIVQAAVANWDKFLETARIINVASKGKVKIVSGVEEFYRPFMSSSDKSWVNNGALSIDSDRLAYMDYAKIFVDENLTHDAIQWSGPWSEGMSNDSTFGYFLPPWGIEWSIPSSVNEQSGWTITEGPQSYIWGGNYFAVSKYCDVSGTAADIIRFFALEEDSIVLHTQYTRNFANNTEVISSMIKDKWRNDLLDNQDYYSVLDSVAKSIEFESHKYDFEISQLFRKSVNDYLSGELSKEKAIDAFKNAVKDSFSDIKIE